MKASDAEKVAKKKVPQQLSSQTTEKKEAVDEQELKQHQPAECRIAHCSLCVLERPFELAPEIVYACNTGQLIIFAGAGVSTESRGVSSVSFYKRIKNELGITDDIPFSKLMSVYCSPPRNRKELLLAIKKSIDHVRAFPELYVLATQFHRELSTIPHIHEIFTTNWDDFFELECDATPVVTGEDFAIFQDIPGRKVFKLHGSIYNYGSIVATEEDYRKCYRQLSTGVVGAKLKIHLLSKTVVFVGFSFEDMDFQKIYRLLSKEVKGMIPRPYFVTLDENAAEKLRSLEINATPIITSASYFVQILKEHLVKDNLMLPDNNFDGIYKAYTTVRLEVKRLAKLGLLKHPSAVYSLMYQNGLEHAFSRILKTRKSGEYSDARNVTNLLKLVDVRIKRRLHGGDYSRVAYLTGYRNGVHYLLLDGKARESFPMYYLFGYGEIPDIESFLKLEKDAAKLHRSAHKHAVKISRGVTPDTLIPRASPVILD